MCLLDRHQAEKPIHVAEAEQGDLFLAVLLLAQLEKKEKSEVRKRISYGSFADNRPINIQWAAFRRFRLC